MFRTTGFFLMALLILLGPSIAALAPASAASAAETPMGAMTTMSESATAMTSAPGTPGAPYPGAIGDMMNCFLPNTAFCDNFSEGPYSGGLANRGGDLDPTKWSFSRLTEGVNPSQGLAFAYPAAVAQFCQTPLPGVLPDRDSFMCNGTNGTDTTFRGTEEMHWMTTIDDGGNYAVNGARALQPFDFAGRTGTVAFAVDAVTRGSHSFWPDVVLADQPVADPHHLTPGVYSPPRNGFEIDFDSGCGGVSGATGPVDFARADYNGTTVGQVTVFTNYAERDINPAMPWAGTCATTSRDDPNLILLRISQTSLDVYMADKAVQTMGADGMMMMSFPTPRLMLHLGQADGFSLPFTRGYVSFQQAQYNAAKFNGTNTMTYHWHNLGFDGPALPAQRAYAVPDAETPTTIGIEGVGVVPGTNIGYVVRGNDVTTCCVQGGPGKKVSPFTLSGVDPSGAIAAYVTFDARGDLGAGPGVQVRLNGTSWHTVTRPPDLLAAATNVIAAIPLAEVRSGTNSLEIKAPNNTVIANIDLVVDTLTPTVVTTTSSTTTTSMSMGTSGTAATTSVSRTTTGARSTTSTEDTAFHRHRSSTGNK